MPNRIYPSRKVRPSLPPTSLTLRQRALSYVPSLTPHLYIPTPERPVRAKSRHLAADTKVVPHHHPWAQVAIATTGVTRLTVPYGTYIVPPARALWVPPGVEHAVTVVEATEVLTLYVYQTPGHIGPDLRSAQDPAWEHCRILEVPPLLRALVQELSTVADGGTPLSAEVLQREHHVSALVQEELHRAKVMRLGVQLPHDKRLRHLCEAVISEPTRHATLEDWAQDTGASPRTLARLFQQELGTSFTLWRQQVVLSKAVAMAAHHQPIGQIAEALGYSPSAFSAMVRRTVGLPASQFLGQQLAPHMD